MAQQLLSIAFPFSVGPQSTPAPAVDIDAINALIEQVMQVKPGERYMRSQLGSNPWDYLFSSNNALLAQGLSLSVSQALARWVPQIVVTGISVDSSSTPNVAAVTVNYVWIPTNTQGSTTVTYKGGN
jgi:phage baseplate assembly protein W